MSSGRAGALALLLFAGAARAEPGAPSATEIKQARQLFSDAEQLRAAGRCAEAAEKLRQALAIKETPGLRFHLAYCEEQLGKLVQANADYARASELIRGGANAPDVARLLEPAQKALSERLPTVQIRVTPAVPGTRVRLDDNEIVPAALGGALPQDPGTHSVVVEADGYERFLLEFALADGEDRVVDASLRSLRPAPAPAPAPARTHVAVAEPERHSNFGAREVVVIGESALALAGLGVGVVFLLKHGSDSDDVEALQSAIDTRGGSCRVDPTRDPLLAGPCSYLPGAIEDRNRDLNVSLAGFIGAGVFGAAAVTTWFLWPSRSRNGSALVVAPLPGGAMVRGSF